MTSSTDTRLMLQFDLQHPQLLKSVGYHPKHLSVTKGRIQAALHHKCRGTEYFFRGTLYETWSEDRFLSWLELFDVDRLSEWLRPRGDFNLVVWDRDARTVVAVTDDIGAHRLYAHAEHSIVTITSRIADQAKLQRRPAFDQDTIHTMLSMSYLLDPWSILRDTWIAGVGTAILCSTSGAEPKEYYRPVTLDPNNNYATVTDCVGGLDTVLRNAIGAHITDDATPVVMLSGGIDSLVLLRYVKELGGPRTTAFTFAVEGRERHELEEAAIAAKYYGVEHHRLVISSAAIEGLTRRALLNIEVFGYGGLEHQGIHEYFRDLSEPTTVFRGEDTRLHTPPLDLPTRIGLAANASGIRSHPMAVSAWKAHALLRHWPVRRGRNYLSYVADKTRLHNDISLAVLISLLRFHYPSSWQADRTVPRRMELLRQEFPYGGSLERTFRWAVSLAYRLQYTDDMHVAHTAVDTCSSTLVMPFYEPDVVRETNRVPLRLAMKRSLVSPRLTRSPFPVADKFILRQLMKKAAPPELLYRRKSTAPATLAQFDRAGRPVILAGLSAWGPALLDKLEGPAQGLAAHYLHHILSLGTSTSADFPMASMALRLLSLSVVSWHIDHPTDGLLDASMALPPWVGP
jgi:hypothetical protein